MEELQRILGSEGPWVLVLVTIGGFVLSFISFGWVGVVGLVIFALVVAVVVLGRTVFREKSSRTSEGNEGQTQNGPYDTDSTPSISDETDHDFLVESAETSESQEVGLHETEGFEADPEDDSLKSAIAAAMERDTDTARYFLDLWVDEASSDEEKRRRKVQREFFMVHAGDGEAVYRLESLADDNRGDVLAQRLFGLSLYFLGSDRRGVEELAARREGLSREDVIDLKLAEANGRLRLDEFPKVNELCSDILESSVAGQRAAAHRLLAKIAEHNGEELLALARRSIALIEDPTDEQERFQLAYAASSAGLDEIAVFHYRRLETGGEPTAMTLNNLGAVLHDGGALALGVNYWRNALDKGSSLAGGNLANAAINVGLFEEAKGFVERASQLEPISVRVGEASQRMAQLREDGIEKRNKMESIGRRGDEVLYQLVISSPPEVPVGEWIIDGQRWIFELTESGSKAESQSGGSYVFERFDSRLSCTFKESRYSSGRQGVAVGGPDGGGLRVMFWEGSVTRDRVIDFFPKA